MPNVVKGAILSMRTTIGISIIFSAIDFDSMDIAM
jgi:hypothetical protein